MRQYLVSLSLVLVVLLGLMTTMTRTQAQEATPAASDDRDRHAPGGRDVDWLNGEGEDAFPSIAHLHPDGSYIEVYAMGRRPDGRLAADRRAHGDRHAGRHRPVPRRTAACRERDGGDGGIDESGNTMITEGIFVERYARTRGSTSLWRRQFRHPLGSSAGRVAGGPDARTPVIPLDLPGSNPSAVGSTSRQRARSGALPPSCRITP